MGNRIYSATQEIQASCNSIGKLARVVKLTISFVIAYIEIVAQDFSAAEARARGQAATRGQSRSGVPAGQTSGLAQYTVDGRTICRNFNRQRGCQLAFCNFAHVCNLKVSGKTCGQAHPNYQHGSAPLDKPSGGNN